MKLSTPIVLILVFTDCIKNEYVDSSLFSQIIVVLVLIFKLLNFISQKVM